MPVQSLSMSLWSQYSLNWRRNIDVEISCTMMEYTTFGFIQRNKVLENKINRECDYWCCFCVFTYEQDYNSAVMD